MKSKSLILAILCVLALSASAGVSFEGSTKPVMDFTPDKNTGLNHIYVLYSAQGVSMSYTASSADRVVWYRYGEMGGGYAEEISGIVREGMTTRMSQVETDCGYIIEEGTNRTYLWVVDYSKYRLTLNSVQPEPASDCGTATLNVSGSGDDIAYATITGVRRILSRDITINYYTLEWNESDLQWDEAGLTETYEGYKPVVVLPAPLCNTTFTISGDRFLKFWNEGISRESDTYRTNAVDVRAKAEQEQRENDNEKKQETGEILGGSAPVNITFTAYCTDAVIHKEWQMATDPDFNDIQLRLNNEVVEETLEEAGTTYWRFIGANEDGTCQAESDTYTVSVGESELFCPNVFSPGTKDGVNDVWKVSYKSIIQFKCWIFNKWGNQIIVLNDPSEGWDGTYNGKLVKSGVYYYVIEARGSDGKNYKLKGDINIINHKKQLDQVIDSGEPATVEE